MSSDYGTKLKEPDSSLHSIRATESPGEQVMEGSSCKIHGGSFEKQIHISLLEEGCFSALGEIWWLGQLLTMLKKKEITNSSQIKK